MCWVITKYISQKSIDGFWHVSANPSNIAIIAEILPTVINQNNIEVIQHKFYSLYISVTVHKYLIVEIIITLATEHSVQYSKLNSEGISPESRTLYVSTCYMPIHTALYVHTG